MTNKSRRFYSHVMPGMESLCIPQWIFQKKKHIPVLCLMPTERQAETLFEQLSITAAPTPVFYFPGWDCLPYDRLSPSQDILAQRIDVLFQLRNLSQNKEPFILCISGATFLQRLPPQESLAKGAVRLKIGGDYHVPSLIRHIETHGYHQSPTVREPGTFALRGHKNAQRLDIFPVGQANPLRLEFDFKKLIVLKIFDAMTQKSLKSASACVLLPAGEVQLIPDTIRSFLSHFTKQDSFSASIAQGRPYPGMEHWLPWFFDHNCETLLAYLPKTTHICIEKSAIQSMEAHWKTIQEYYEARQKPFHDPLKKQPITYRALPPRDLYLSVEEALALCSTDQSLEFGFESFASQENQPTIDMQGKNLCDFSVLRSEKADSPYEGINHQIESYRDSGKTVVLACATEGSRHRLVSILNAHGLEHILCINQWPAHDPTYLRPPIYAIVFPLDRGFEMPNWVALSEQDLLGDRLARLGAKKRKTEDFFKETNDLSEGDIIVHQDHGIGIYLGLESIQVEHIVHDCAALEYAGGDKLYIPVENIDSINRYGSAGGSATLDRLGSSAWLNRKEHTKNKIREVAQYLLKTAALRTLREAPIFPIPKSYEEFCARFPYVETDDQLQAIEDTLSDLQLGKPMDRLICGDVGFGKTEVALRASYIVAAQGKQVAIIVPTTLLCRQHFASFSARFEGTPFRVAQLSRLVNTKEAKNVHDGLKSGEIDIVISTHGLLNGRKSFRQLGLLVIDEEQHFGVKQKESLKKDHIDLHVLTLSATPIPRTLQMALTGVRELSLITTPPVDRLAVRTFLMEFDLISIREIILREHKRGGQTFFVCPRLEDIKKIQATLRSLVPEVHIGVAHGKLAPNDLEEVISQFCERHYHVLLSTNIVESGIDVANANTMIIYRADLFGLGQLYQLRGRVGRAKTQAYAYLTVLDMHQISVNAQKRLDVMKSLDSLGAGFTLASHDMDIRGTGNLVGEEQSGYIREVGADLYQKLLQEAILMERAEADSTGHSQTHFQAQEEEWSPQINIGTSVLIPETYVEDLTLRLGLYRRLSELRTRHEIDAFAAELIDRFGAPPPETQSLLDVIEIKALCRQAGIEKIDTGPKGVVFSFRNHQPKNVEAIVALLQAHPSALKLHPDHRLMLSMPWTHPSQRIRSIKKICLGCI